MINLKGIVEYVKNFLVLKEETDDTGSNTVEEALAEAYKEWIAAQMLFEENADPDMIDFTIYNLKAAEHRYSYLLRKAKREYTRCSDSIQATELIETCLFL